VVNKAFRVFFAGRIEKNKGVYDVLAIAERCDKQRPGEFLFDVCGEGSQLEPLRARALPPNIEVHGVCDPSRLLSLLGRSNVVIVPTRTTFEEGFNKVCAEGVLAGRPVITSAVCPALHTIKEAAIEVKPDDVAGYYEAILCLRDDTILYEQKCGACGKLQAKFYDLNNSWAACIRGILRADEPVHMGSSSVT
jgi:glycosyltransferase involved in cell wall biosynthesis